MKNDDQGRCFVKSSSSLKLLVIGLAAFLLIGVFAVPSNSQVLGADAGAGNAPGGDTRLRFDVTPREPIGTNSIQTRYADLDADGFWDIVAINGGQASPNPTLTIIYGSGNGEFGTPQVIPTYMIGHAIAIGDLNGDGKPDIVAASFYQAGLAVFVNQGNRQFSSPVFTIPPEREFFDLAIADFDGDGQNDVVALEDQIDQRLKFFHFNANGTLTLFATISQNSGGTSYEAVMEVGDVNNDGRPDVILAGGGPFGVRGFSYVYGQTPGGTLSMTYGLGVTDKAVGIAVADLDNDGDNEMAVAFLDTTTPTRHSLQVSRNGGNGVFTALSPIFLEYPFPPNDITIADFNNDGKKDLAALINSVYDGGIMVLVMYGNGDCTFSGEKYYAVSPSSSIFSADLNGDSRIDLITASSFLDQTNYIDENHVSLLFNDGPRGFRAPLVKLWGPNFIDAGDFDNDGFRDMVSSWTTTFSTTSGADISINDKLGGFFEEVRYDSPAALSDMKVGDFNGDGNADVVTAHSYNTRKLATYFGNGTGTLGNAITTSFSEQLTKILVGDLNTDGKDDVVAVDSSGKAYAMLSVGNGTFNTAPNSPFAIGSSLPDLHKGDFNLDHAMDLIIAGKLWIGDGKGRFAQSAATLPALAFYVPGDFNGDGKLDIAGTNGDYVYGVLGDGAGGFSGTFSRAIPNNSLYNTVQSVVSADFDLDGFDDVALLMKDNLIGNLIVFTSGGATPSWNEPHFYGVGTATRTLVAADFNGDRKPDIEWLGDNSRGVIFNTTPGRSYRTPFDYDGDGKTDASVYRPTTGDWYLLRSAAGFGAFHFGSPSDVLTPADFTGDGKTDVAVWRPSDGTWYVLRSEDNTFYGAGFGTAGDTPTPGDFDGDGKADLAVFRPGAQAYWYLQQSTAGFAVVPFGTTGDVPAAGDYDGDGKNDVSVYRPSLGQWFRFNSGNGSFYGVQFGAVGDMIVPADYTGDGKTDNAVFRPSTSTWYILRSETPTFYGAAFGTAGDLPSPGDYDGDGKADLAVWRSGAQGVFYIQASTTGFNAIPWGVAGDRPTANAYVY